MKLPMKISLSMMKPLMGWDSSCRRLPKLIIHYWLRHVTLNYLINRMKKTHLLRLRGRLLWDVAISTKYGHGARERFASGQLSILIFLMTIYMLRRLKKGKNQKEATRMCMHWLNMKEIKLIGNKPWIWWLLSVWQRMYRTTLAR